jgi:hypothetical protein
VQPTGTQRHEIYCIEKQENAKSDLCDLKKPKPGDGQNDGKSREVLPADQFACHVRALLTCQKSTRLPRSTPPALNVLLDNFFMTWHGVMAGDLPATRMPAIR